MNTQEFLAGLPGFLGEVPPMPKRRSVGSIHEEKIGDYEARLRNWRTQLAAQEEKRQRAQVSGLARGAINGARVNFESLLATRAYTEGSLNEGSVADYPHMMGRLFGMGDDVSADPRSRHLLAALLRNTQGVSGVGRTETVDGVIAFVRSAVADPTMLASTVITVGYGSPDVEAFSLRLPVYLLPALQLMEDLRLLGFPLPRLRVLIAVNAGIAVNGFDVQKALRNAHRTETLLTRFVSTFYPELVSCLRFEHDASEYEQLHMLEQTLVGMARAEEVEEGDVTRVLRVLQGQASRKGDGNALFRALRYGALHPLIFGDLGGPEIAEEHHLSIGGPPERYFNALRLLLPQRLAHGLHAPKSNLLLLTDAGRNPVYFPLDGELTFGSRVAVSWEELKGAGSFSRDWEEVERCLSPSAYLAWVGEVNAELEGSR